MAGMSRSDRPRPAVKGPSQLGKVELAEQVLEGLAGLEFHDGLRGDGHIDLGLLGIAADAGLSFLHLEDTNVAQLHIPAPGQRVNDGVEGQLDRGHDLLPGVAGLAVDFIGDFLPGQVVHRVGCFPAGQPACGGASRA